MKISVIRLCLSEYVWVYVFLMDAKTVLPIISKLGIVIEGIFCSILNYKRRGTQGEGRIGGGGDTRAKPGLLLKHINENIKIH